MYCPICNAPLKRTALAVSRLVVCEQCGRVVSAVSEPQTEPSQSVSPVVEAQLAPQPVAVWNAREAARLEAEVYDELTPQPPDWAVPVLTLASLAGVTCWLAFRPFRNTSAADDLAVLAGYEVGILFFCAGLFDWRWFWKGWKQRNMRRLFGPTFARRCYMTFGALVYLISISYFCFG
jgi:hypothetical protein